MLSRGECCDYYGYCGVYKRDVYVGWDCGVDGAGIQFGNRGIGALIYQVTIPR